MTVKVVIDARSQALIERCAAVLCEAGLEDVIDRMADAGLFREAVTIRSGVVQNTIVVGLGLMTELLLLEYIDIAQHRGWSELAKRDAMAHAALLAGFL